MTDAYKEFGAYLREYREARGLRLREVARNAEMSHAYLSQVERGEPRSLSDEKLVALGKALHHESLPELFARAGRISPLESAILRKNADAWSLFISYFKRTDDATVKAALKKLLGELPKKVEDKHLLLTFELGAEDKQRHGTRKRRS